MSQQKYGPWYATQPDYAGGWWVVSKDPEGDDCIDESADGGFEEGTARLVAAAPELLEALEAMCEYTAELDFNQGFDGNDPPAVNKAREAIMKAKGEA